MSVNVHVSREKELEAQGWVRVMIGAAGDRIEMAHPDRTCLQPTRVPGGVQPCMLDKNHGRYHSVSVFHCDLCGRMRRLPWAAADENAAVCFFCQRAGERRREGYA